MGIQEWPTNISSKAEEEINKQTEKDKTEEPLSKDEVHEEMLGEKEMRVEESLINLFLAAGQREFNNNEIKFIAMALKEFDFQTQEKIGKDFFDRTIGQNISNNRNAYEVYLVFKRTTFGKKFAELEDARLKEAGYEEGFKL